MKENDPVNPAHYQKGGIEAFKIFEAYLTKEELIGFCKATILQYILRANDKNGLEDYKKANWYLDRLIEKYSPEEKIPTINDAIDKFCRQFENCFPTDDRVIEINQMNGLFTIGKITFYFEDLKEFLELGEYQLRFLIENHSEEMLDGKLLLRSDSISNLALKKS